MKKIQLSFQPRCRFRAAALSVLLSCVASVAFAAEDPTDVTAKVSAAVKDGKLSIAASNALFGDTASGVHKKLHAMQFSPLL